MDIKYLFKVEFTDGSFFEQDPSDVSSIDPKRSQFYDLLQIKKPMRRAWLFENYLFPRQDTEQRPLDELMVDLHDGHFELNGLWLQIDQNPLPSIQRGLIFFRERQHDTNINYDLKTGHVNTMKETANRTKYFIGWEVTINNKSYKQIIGLK